MTGSWT